MDDELIEEVLRVRRAAMDDARPDAVAKVHARGKFTARERIAMLLDEDSFVEYGVLSVPSNRNIVGPADGLVQGVGTIDGSPVTIASYDYTVQGGTQTALNHGKFDRLIELSLRPRLAADQLCRRRRSARSRSWRWARGAKRPLGHVRRNGRAVRLGAHRFRHLRSLVRRQREYRRPLRRGDRDP